MRNHVRDLLEACKRLRDAFGPILELDLWTDGDDPVYRMACEAVERGEAAIAKAEGAQPDLEQGLLDGVRLERAPGPPLR